jgi:hypothetical protein
VLFVIATARVAWLGTVRNKSEEPSLTRECPVWVQTGPCCYKRKASHTSMAYTPAAPFSNSARQ